MRPVEVRLRDLPKVSTDPDRDYVKVGAWTMDPIEEPDATKAWENAKAWAAYALWLQAR